MYVTSMGSMTCVVEVDSGLRERHRRAGGPVWGVGQVREPARTECTWPCAGHCNECRADECRCNDSLHRAGRFPLVLLLPLAAPSLRRVRPASVAVHQ